jgi:rfaE bifunctional protein nucleotidyltransferase chain/domain/rfaE bifunctional protein kinase chain/domain
VSGSLVVIGDLLLDRDVDGVVERLSPDAPVAVLEERSVESRPGGAGLAAALAAADGRDVTLVTALADDAAGRELEQLLRERGVELVDLGLAGATPEKVRLRTGDRALLRLDRGGREPGAVGRASAGARAAIGWAEALLVSDYGRGVAASPEIRELLAERAATGLPTVWDPHPRGPAPVEGVALATPNAAEAALFADGAGDGLDELAAAIARAAALRRRWSAGAVCITRGARGALLDAGGEIPLAIAAPRVDGGDPCGAGDRFAAAAAAVLADGGAVSEAVQQATEAAARFVAAGGAGGFAKGAAADPVLSPAAAAAPGSPPLESALARIAATRAAGGVVVAAGGCFDLLHPGHVRLLKAARELGDCLVVCINSDASVRRLKGPSRPLLPAHERADVLLALGCVDAVVPFEEETPCALLERLRPDLWVKGGDYAGRRLPESELLERWGGRTVLVPHHAGHSTTRLIEEAIDRAAS